LHNIDLPNTSYNELGDEEVLLLQNIENSIAENRESSVLELNISNFDGGIFYVSYELSHKYGFPQNRHSH
jgi:hypothetical protein